MLGYIYKITNIVNNKIYIGQTVRTIAQRWYNHKHIANKNLSNKHLYVAMRKYGIDNFKIEEIDSAETKIDLDNKEMYWIDFYHTTDPSFGYNIGKGGEANFLGLHHTLETKKKISEASKNQVWTDERRLKISLAQKGICNHIQTESERKKRSISLKKAYQEGRRTPVKGGWKCPPRDKEDIEMNSIRQKGKKWMYNTSLGLRCMVFKNNQENFLSLGWEYGFIKSYHLIHQKEIIK